MNEVNGQYGSALLSTGDEQVDVTILTEAFKHASLQFKFPKTATPRFGWVRIPQSSMSLAYWYYEKPSG